MKFLDVAVNHCMYCCLDFDVMVCFVFWLYFTMFLSKETYPQDISSHSSWTPCQCISVTERTQSLVRFWCAFVRKLCGRWAMFSVVWRSSEPCHHSATLWLSELLGHSGFDAKLSAAFSFIGDH